MRSISEESIRKILEKGDLPEGTDLVEFDLPRDATSVDKSIGARLPDGSVVFFIEFISHDEWKTFQKTRKLAVMFPLGEVPPFFIGALNEGNSSGPEFEEQNHN